MPILGQIKGTKTIAKLWTPTYEVESGALDQVRNVASLDPVKHVCIMPDVHTGKGACIGSVIAMKDAVCASLTGVDIGCGMEAVRTNLTVEDISQGKLEQIYEDLKIMIPVGFNSRETPHYLTKNSVAIGGVQFLDPELREHESSARHQLGTLGGGNHFIEISRDEDGTVWLMLHSGSRNIGYKIADHYIKKAIKLMPTGLPDRALAYFTDDQQEYHNYLRDMTWAQQFAAENRRAMMTDLMKVVADYYDLEEKEYISCHHNFAQVEEHHGEELVVIRKGAIEAKEGQMGIIPGAMGRESYIVRGLGNNLALCSAPHGAGRKMSRSRAKKAFTVDQLEKSLKGIIARRDKGVLDEIGDSYKDINKVMSYSSDLVEPVAKLNQMLCIKG